MTLDRWALRSRGRLDAGFVALLCALVIFPLYPKVGLISVSGTYVPVRLDDLVTVVVVVAWGWTLARERRWPRLPLVAPFAAAWILAGLIGLVIGAGLIDTINWSTGLLFWAKPIEYLLLGWAAYDLVNEPRRLRTVLWAVFLTAAVVLGYAVLERFQWVLPAPNYATDVTARRGVLGSTMGDQHQMATYLGIVALAGIALWHRLERPLRWLGIAGLMVCGYVLVHAAGRSEFFSLMLAAMALGIWPPARRPAAAMVVSLVIAFALPAAAEHSLDAALRNPARPVVVDPSASPGPAPSGPRASSTPSSGPSQAPIAVSERMDDLGADRSLEIRLRERWPVFLRIAMRDPIFGAGPSAATEAADGYYIRSFTEVGIVGTATFFALLGSVVFGLWLTFRRVGRSVGSLALGLIAATFFTALVGVLIDTWVASRVMQLFWPLVGAALGAASVTPWNLRRSTSP